MNQWTGPDCLIKEVTCSDEYLGCETEKVAFQVTPEFHARLLEVVAALKVFQKNIGDDFASVDTSFKASYVPLKTDWDSDDEELVVAEGDRFDFVSLRVNAFAEPHFEVLMGIKHTSATLSFQFDLSELQPCLQAYVSRSAEGELMEAFDTSADAAALARSSRGPSL